MFHKTLVFLGILFFSTVIFPVQSRPITRIVFHGLNHAANLSIIKKIMLDQHKQKSLQDINNIIKTLYNTNYFINVRVKKIKETFFFYVTEFPKIKKIFFSGNNILSESFLNNSLHRFGIFEDYPFNLKKYNDFLSFLKECYYNRGIFGIKIKPLYTKSLNNNVSININVYENAFFNVSDIKIVGNKQYPNAFILKKFFQFNRYFFFPRFLQKQYTFSQFKEHLLELKNFYKNNGYLKIKINQLKVFENQDHNSVSIVIELCEGEKYTFKKIVTHQVKSEYFNKNIDIKRVFIPAVNFQESDVLFLKKNKKLYAHVGFSNVKVTIRHDINEIDKSVIIYILIEPKEQFFINKIYFVGNTKSKYSFLKKIIKTSKHSYCDKYTIKKNCQLLQNTDLFNTVYFKTYKAKGLLNTINVYYVLEDKKDNQLVCSAGFDSKSKLLLKFLYYDKNFLGLGYRIYSNVAKNLYLTQVNTYFSKSLESLKNFTFKFRCFFDSIDKTYFDPTKYIDKYYGFDSKLITPVIKNKRFSVSIGSFMARFPYFSPQFSLMQYINFFRDHLKSKSLLRNFSILDFVFKYVFNYNNIHLENLVKIGNQIKLIGKFTLPFSDNKFHKITLSSENFFPLEHTKSFLLHMYSALGIGFTFGKNIFPIYENYYIGGSQSVRGFQNNSLGPRAFYYYLKNLLSKKDNKSNDQIICESANPVGGNVMIHTNMELLFPHIHTHNSLLGYFQYGIFLDTANLWDSSLRYMLNIFKNIHMIKFYNPSKIYMSTGAFVRWFSFLGPVTVTFSIPLLYEGISNYNLLRFYVDFNTP
ncbi:outer membrane protein precursor [Buchnera aphidicola (Cinara tujafilina)]|uniref:Outer membrane protein assembly factor BamA n=1 Tax=Buchnera aphidicola (Cinara tujafilina) TaxID=261317 RepID=F7WZ84_9GAMM|nr:outer membrane protein assembly factor BamA [Buchnera aphidicola]AEH39738.1 outer membrane protein precursor [Buchnera aphidicola (Cinara tujafilina)]